MRSLKQIAINEKSVFAVAHDGTFWRAEMWTEGAPKWKRIEGPPEGDHDPLTMEEIGDKMRKKGRAMIIGRGKKNETEAT